MDKEHTGRVLSLNKKLRPHLDEIQLVSLAGQYYLRISHHCSKGQFFGQDFLQIGSVLDPSATLPTVAAFHISFGENIINWNSFLNWNQATFSWGTTAATDWLPAHRTAKRNHQPWTGQRKKHWFYLVSSLVLWKSEVHPLSAHKM